MPIVEAILQHPTTPGFTELNLGIQSVVGITRSPFTGSQQAIKWPGSWWEAQVALPWMTRAQAEEWIAFILNCDGPFRKFKLGDPTGKIPRGAGAGSAPQVDGAGQGGSIISTKNWPINLVNALVAGDYLEIEDHLYKVTYPEDTDGAGKATFDIRPPLRTNPADGQPIIISNCKGIFRMKNNQNPWRIDAAKNFLIQFECYEAF